MVSGTYGNGAYDILGPTGNCFGFPPRGAKAGDVVELFGVGFGPTAPAVPSGKVYSGAAPITEPFSLYINGVMLTPTFVGLSSAGVYQINVVIPPGLGQGDVPDSSFCRWSANPEESVVLAGWCLIGRIVGLC